MKKLLPLIFVGLAGCLAPPVPGFEFNETVQAVDDSLPGGVTFVQNIPFITVTRVNDVPLTSGDQALALQATRQYCAAEGGQFNGTGRNLMLGLPTFRDGAWLFAGTCTQPAPLPLPTPQAVAEAVTQ